MKKVLLLVVCLSLMGCDKQENQQYVEEKKQQKESTEVGQESEWSGMTLDSWVVYWDFDNVEEELALLGNNLATLSYFEAYFDENDKIKVPEGFIEQCKRWNTTAQTYITVVNDIVYEGKDNSLKDTEILYRLLQGEENRKKHIQELASLAKELGVDGVEIDYERLRKDQALWQLFEVFCNELEEVLTENDLQLRIVLEPSAPFETLSLPANAEYVIMCYNLHSGAGDEGPKADEEFLKELAQKASSLGGNCVFALATGGFDWSKGSVSSVTEQKAAQIAAESGADLIRDSASMGLTYSYKDEDGKNHTVWYADGETIVSWIDWVQERGDYNIAIWRLNGNSPESIAKWMQ